jgi:hypothetical protein
MAAQVGTGPIRRCGSGVHAVVALGAGGEPQRRPRPLARARVPRRWSTLHGEAAFLAAALPADKLPAEPDAMAEPLAAWTLARLEDLKTVLPDLAAG